MADSAKFSPGDVLDGRYRIDSLIAVGGMGAVYAGTHLLLHKRIAVKVLRDDLQSQQTMVGRFQREAIAASAIGHENIVSVTDMGTTSDGVAYLVMELLQGQNLADLIEADAPLNAELACDIALEILSGIAAAHHAGIVHRDLKPENIYLSHRPLGRDRVKILDFGVSRLTAGSQPTPDVRLTSTGMIMGTPRYMSPEQARGESTLTHSTDIYATGVILYEMLANEVPYGAQNYNILVHKILSAETMPLVNYRPDLPPGLVDAVEKSMLLDPLDRFLTAEEFGIAIAPFSTNPKSAPTLPLTLPRARKSTGPAYKSEKSATVVESSGLIPIEARRGGHPGTSFSDEAPEVRRGGNASQKWGGLLAVLAVVGGIAAFVLYSRKDAGGDKGEPAEPPPAVSQKATPDKQGVTPPSPTPPTPVPVEDKGDVEPPPDKTTASKPTGSKPSSSKPSSSKPSSSKPSGKDPAKPKGKSIAITFKVTPSDARITVDGETLSGNVYKTEATKVAASVVITSPGHIPYASSVSLEGNETVKVKLKKTPQAPPPPEDVEPKPDEPKPEPEPSP